MHYAAMGPKAPRSTVLTPQDEGFFYIDIAEVRTEEGKLHLFVAVDRTSQFVFAQLHATADRPTACAFLEALIAACAYDLKIVLTNNVTCPPRVPRSL